MLQKKDTILKIGSHFMNPLRKKYILHPYCAWLYFKRELPYRLRGTFSWEANYSKLVLKKHTPRIDEEAIVSYWSKRKYRKATSVIYTCITNNYDDINEIACPYYINHNWDYVCYTDNQDDIKKGKVGVWEIRPLEFSTLDNTRNNRWHKTHPHILFPDYHSSIYIDANIDILSPWLFNAAENSNEKIFLPRHYFRNCIYDEFSTVLIEFLDDIKTVLSLKKIIKKSGMPPNYGLTENNIIFRKHHDPDIKMLMENWWEIIKHHSKRDQLSLSWLLWKQSIPINEISRPNVRDMPEDLIVFGHKH